MDSGIDVCRLCHNAIHDFFDEKTLGKEYNTLEKLISHPKVQDFIVFAKKQK